MNVKRMAVSFVLLASLAMSALGQDPGARFSVHPDRWTLGPDADWKVYWYAGDLTIPSVLDGYPVTQIDSRAFYRCSELRSVSIPSSVTSISNSSFSHCSGL